MMPDQQTRLLELFAACSQQTLTEAERHELQAALRADADARKLWFLHQDLEMGLKLLSGITQETANQLQGSATVNLLFTSTHVENGNRLASRSAHSWLTAILGTRRSSAIVTLALVCLSAVVMFGVHAWNRPRGLTDADENKITNNRAHDFIIESPTHGTTFTLSDHKGKAIALHFLLKSECPYCLKLAHDYGQLARSNPDVVHLFLKPDNANDIKVWAEKINHDGLSNPPIIYRDPDARLANEFGIPDGYKFHGQTVHYPALILLDSSGKELFRYVGKNNSDRMQPEDFIARLAMVTHHN